jgi:hypothetical protein
MDHTPPLVALVNAGVEDPIQTIAAPPFIAETTGGEFTVKFLEALLEQPLLVTV